MAVSDPSNQRGQLLLIGAISLAFILLGVVIVFNSALYTETISSGDAGEDIQNKDIIESEISNGVATVIEHQDGSTIGDANESVFEWGDAYTNSTAEQGPELVTIESADFINNTGGEITGSDPLSMAENLKVTYRYITTSVSVESSVTVNLD